MTSAGHLVHRVQRADAGDPPLAFDVLQQRTVKLLPLAAGHGLDVSHHDQQLLGA